MHASKRKFKNYLDSPPIVKSNSLLIVKSNFLPVILLHTHTHTHTEIHLYTEWSYDVYNIAYADYVLIIKVMYAHSVQFSSVAQSCPTLCDPMNRSTPGLPVHHQLPEFTQTHVHRVSGAIQPSHPLSSPSPPTPNPSQHQCLFQL